MYEECNFYKKKNYPSEMAHLWTFYSNPKWYQLFVYLFSKKKIFLRETTPTHFKLCQGQPETSIFAMFVPTESTREQNVLIFRLKMVLLI